MASSATAELTIAEAQRIAVEAQALARLPGPASKADVLALIRRLGLIQIDTIHVVARSPYLVLWSRLGDYDPRWLDELLYPDRAVFEYWAHAASILPIEHWPLFRDAMLRYGRGEIGWWTEWHATNAPLIAAVLDEIRTRGPLGSADFEAPPGHRGSWWDWKPAKRALDVLWSSGELMIERRVNFHRRYDLRERLLPDWDDARLPTEDERRYRLADIALAAMGLATTKQLADYFRQRMSGLQRTVDALVADGRARRVAVAGWSAPAYLHHTAVLPERAPELTTLLSPFDNLIWDRERDRALWDFDYTIECYVPEPKRRYGYFTLPILRRGQLVGRLDPKAERKAGVFRVKALFLEPAVDATPELLADIAGAIRRCALWHRTPEVVLERAEPAVILEPLRALLRAG